MLTTKTHRMTMGALMIALTAICAQLMLPLGAVQFSLQVFAVFLTASLLPPLWSAGSLLGYLLLGTFGAPVFGGLRGGPGVLLGATGGFLLVFPLMALLIAWVQQRFALKTPLALFGSMVLSLPLCYAAGCGWFCLMTGNTVGQALTITVLPFVLPDLLKAAAAAWLAPTLRKRLRAN